MNEDQHKPDTALQHAAVSYAQRGWAVLPLWWIENCRCACRKTDCDRPGKHPLGRLVPNGVKDASSDREQVAEWWQQYPSANIGLACGVASGRLVLDVDGELGRATLAQLESEHGALPVTVESLTGNGRHIHFDHVRGLRNEIKFAPGLDIRTDNGYVVAPPSRHVSGRIYAWNVEFHPDDIPLAQAPSWLLNLIRAAQVKPTPQSTGDEIPKGYRHRVLVSLAGAMRFRGAKYESIFAALVEENKRRCRPPLPADEVEQIARSVAKYEPGIRIPAFSPDSSPIEAAWPAAIGDDGLHGLAGDVVRTLDPHTESDPAAILFQFIASFGNAIGRTAYFRAEAHRHYTNLFVVLVGVTSKGRKGTSWGHVQSMFDTGRGAKPLLQTASGLSSGEGLIWAVRDPITTHEAIRERGQVTGYQDVVEDPGVSDKRLLVVESEYAIVLRVLARDGNTLSAVIRNAWDTGDMTTLVKHEPAKATGAHISIIGHVTKDELLRYLDDTESGNGFGNRFLWPLVRRSKVLPEGGNITETELQPLRDRLAAAVSFARECREVRRDEGARDLWHEVYARLSEGLPGLLGAMTARAEAQVMRLATIYALLDCSGIIAERHLRAALAVWRYAEDSARIIFGSAMGNPLADDLLKMLRDAPGGLTRSEIREQVGRHKTGTQIDNALETLRHARIADTLIEPTGGRPTERWFAVMGGGTKETKATKGGPGPPLVPYIPFLPRALPRGTSTTKPRSGRACRPIGGRPMSSPLAISNVRFTPATPADIGTGLLGWVACILDDRLYLDGIALRRTASPGRLALSFPARRDRRGGEHPYIRPVDALARQEIERVIFAAIAAEVAPTGRSRASATSARRSRGTRPSRGSRS